MKLLQFLWLLVRLIFWANSAALLVAVLSPFISPYEIWIPALFGLFFKVFFILNLVLLLLFLFGRRKGYLLLSILMVLFSLQSVYRTVAFGFHNPRYKDGLKVITYNMKYQHLCERIPGSAYYTLLPRLLKIKPDVIFFQEFNYANNCSDFVGRLEKEGYRYYYSSFNFSYKSRKMQGKTGMIVFSRHPLFHFKPLVKVRRSDNGAYQVDMKVGDDTLRLINAHLQSIGLRKKEYAVPEETTDTAQLKTYGSSLRKLRLAFRRRAYQVSEVTEAIAQSPYKIIFAGDCNDTPVSFTYDELIGRLDDTYIRSGMGIGSTFAGKIPMLRIDYILVSHGLVPVSSEVLHWQGSDHYPLYSVVHL